MNETRIDIRTSAERLQHVSTVRPNDGDRGEVLTDGVHLHVESSKEIMVVNK